MQLHARRALLPLALALTCAIAALPGPSAAAAGSPPPVPGAQAAAPPVAATSPAARPLLHFLSGQANTQVAAGTAGASAYWLVASDGGIFSFGGVPFEGSTGAIHLNRPIVAMAAAPDGRGYWLVASDGGIFAFGDARFFGSPPGLPASVRPTRPVVAIQATSDGGGYWVATDDGSIYTFGNARFAGSVPSLAGAHLGAPVVAMAAAPDGGGYWLAAADGEVFAFGTAGNAGSAHPARPIVGMAAAPQGGYWLVASDGGIFGFGNAAFHGSTGAVKLNQPVVGMASTPSGLGYWLVASDGGIFSFGDAAFGGSTGGRRLNQPIVGMAVGPPLDPFAAGAKGYDISFPQCGGAFPAPPFAFGIVGANNGRPFIHNPCLADQRAWAGSVLSAYMNLSAPPKGAPQAQNGPAGRCAATDTGCLAYNYGFNAAADAYGFATAQGASTGLWWLDVETENSWDVNTANNARTIQGALDALGAQGVLVGIYSTGFQWSIIAGSFAPKTPIWVATGSDFGTAVDFCAPSHGFGAGTIWLTQYGTVGSSFDFDLACPLP